MTTISDEKLYEHAHRLKGKVVLITGAANGIGKETALRCASYGAKIVIGDTDVAGAEKTVKDIKTAGGEAVFLKCNVTVYEDQIALFEVAMAMYGAVDVVIPNAGVSESGTFDFVAFSDGKPVKPDLKTMDVNLVGAIYTAHLAQHYLEVNREPGSLKSLVIIASMSSWLGFPGGAIYTASKHALLGLMRCLWPMFKTRDTRIATVHPFFADTGIVPPSMRLFLAGIQLAPVPRIAGAIVHAATNPDPETSGVPYLLANNGSVLMLPREELKLGVYELIDRRVNMMVGGIAGITYYSKVTTDLVRVVAPPLVVAGLGISAVKLGWTHRELVLGYLHKLL
ncbi:5'-hydroxyaverantin dehydrogenase [Hypsizygus marmoreus]|uniref:5'-hydroxyaverantin dehydrogenase n=1 Tax=Hypsizygus marmoreus TaxID=39966 RepID=A0A369JW95_HYPMA|nr:5'-hydroxyaverantin dehydrogenase [Hypsizygus marmoreus]